MDIHLDYVMVDQHEWIENAIKERARLTFVFQTIEIVNLYSQYKINKGESITAIWNYKCYTSKRMMKV